MTQFQTALYNAIRVKKYGWDYSTLIFESGIRENPTEVMHELNGFSFPDGPWMATMRVIENNEIIEEDLFDSSYNQCEDRPMRKNELTVFQFNEFDEMEQIETVWKKGVLLAEVKDGEYKYQLYQIDSSYVEFKKLLSDPGYGEMKTSHSIDLLDRYVGSININSIMR